MQEQMSDIEWELRQLWMAVDYYERAFQWAYYGKELDKDPRKKWLESVGFEEAIVSLKKQIKNLERKRDEFGNKAS